MTTSPTGSIPAPSATERVPLRLRLAASFSSGPLDGAWWPQTRDLQLEAADLVDHFPQQVGRVERLLYSPPDWDTGSGTPGARRIWAERGAIKVGSFPSDDTHLMVAKISSGRRIRLLVVPSGTEPGRAETAMREAADEADTRTAAALLGLSGPDQGHIGDAAWDEHV